MAVVKSILKLTNTEAVVKVAGIGTVSGVDDNVTIVLTSAEMVKAPMETLTDEAPVVRLLGLQWAGEPDTVYKITRNNVRIATVTANNGNFMDFVELFPPDMDNATSDITVTIQNANGTPAQGEIWLRLRKVSGYSQFADGTSSILLTTQLGDYINNEDGYIIAA